MMVGPVRIESELLFCQFRNISFGFVDYSSVVFVGKVALNLMNAILSKVKK